MLHVHCMYILNLLYSFHEIINICLFYAIDIYSIYRGLSILCAYSCAIITDNNFPAIAIHIHVYICLCFLRENTFFGICQC